MSTPQTFIIEVTMEQIQTVFAVLENVQWKVANPIIQAIHAQVQAQMPKGPEAAAPAVARRDETEDEEGAREPKRPRRAVQDAPDRLRPQREANGDARRGGALDAAADELGERGSSRV